MFDHIKPKIEPAAGYTPVENASAAEIFEAKDHTLRALASMGVVDDESLENPSDEEKENARRAFAAFTGSASEELRQRSVAMLESPGGVAYASTMLAAYDWEFVEQASNIRAFVVTRLIEEATLPKSSPNARIRALELLGKVSEVSLFNDKVQIHITQASQDELETRLKQKLAILEAIDVDAKEIRNE